MARDDSASLADFDTGIAIAHALADAAIWSGDACAWTGAYAPPTAGAPSIFKSFGGELYDGSAGIARLLARAALLTGDERLKRTALGAMAHAFARSAPVSAAAQEAWSLFAGAAGVALVGFELARNLAAPQLLAPAFAALDRASAAAIDHAATGPFDLLAGTAGVIVAILEAAEHDPKAILLRRAFVLGHALIAAARIDPLGWSWPASPSDGDHLCGLAHGAAGIALAFARLADFAPEDPRWAAAATAARGYERRWFAPDAASWADLRSDGRAAPSDPPAYPHFWCHGSVGIGAERLRALALGGGDAATHAHVHADALAALAGATRTAQSVLAGAAGPGGGYATNASLCHGLSGIVDLLLDADRLDPSPDRLALARRLTAFIRNDAGPARRWRSGVPNGEPTPGLMLGDAGIAWTMLRAALPTDLGSAWDIRLGGQAI